VNVKVSGRHAEVTEALKQYAVEKVGRLGKHFDSPRQAQVVLDVDDDRRIAEVVLPLVKHKVLTAKAEDKDMYAAIDLVVDKLDRQLVRFKERLSDHRIHGASKSEGAEGGEESASDPSGDEE
jgi:putative sigma-54 modulation protein